MRISDWSSDVCSSDLCSPVMRAPSASTLASLCSRLRRAEVTSWQSAARAPGWRFTAMEMQMPVPQTKIGRAPCRERVCQYVLDMVVDIPLKTQKQISTTQQITFKTLVINLSLL